VLSKAQKKVKCVGEMAVNGDGELVITPHGSAPSNIGTKVKIALKEESVQGINGVTINKAKPESEETSPPSSGETVPQPGSSGEPGQSPSTEESEFQQRVKDFLPKFQQALQRVPHPDVLKRAWDETKKFWQEKVYGKANDLLDALEKSVERSPQAPVKKERRLVPAEEGAYQRLLHFCETMPYKAIIEMAALAQSEFAKNISLPWHYAQEDASNKDFKAAAEKLETVLRHAEEFLPFYERVTALQDPSIRRLIEQQSRDGAELMDDLLRDFQRMEDPRRRGINLLRNLESTAFGVREPPGQLDAPPPWDEHFDSVKGQLERKKPLSQKGEPPPARAGDPADYAAKFVPWVKAKCKQCEDTIKEFEKDSKFVGTPQAFVWTREWFGELRSKLLPEMDKSLAVAQEQLGRAATEEKQQQARFQETLASCKAKLEKAETNSGDWERCCAELEEAVEGLLAAADSMEEIYKVPAVDTARSLMRSFGNMEEPHGGRSEM